jgi:predicted ArsR family transcriptional regulator
VVNEADLEAIGLLQDPTRRSLYAFVAAQARDVSRNEAAEAVGLQRTLAAFHLDRLADAGLLEVTYRRLSARSGPGAGRPAKLYRRAAAERTASLPPRDYARAASTFAEAIERSGAEAALYATARAQGDAAARALVQAAGSPRLSLEALWRELTERGYEPYAPDPVEPAGCVRLRNCPFRSVSHEFPVVTCGMNLALVEGLLQGGGLMEHHLARLEPRPDECCVTIVSKISDN